MVRSPEPGMLSGQSRFFLPTRQKLCQPPPHQQSSGEEDHAFGTLWIEFVALRESARPTPSQAKVRSTTQRFGNTTKRWDSLPSTIGRSYACPPPDDDNGLCSSFLRRTLGAVLPSNLSTGAAPPSCSCPGLLTSDSTLINSLHFGLETAVQRRDRSYPPGKDNARRARPALAAVSRRLADRIPLAACRQLS